MTPQEIFGYLVDSGLKPHQAAGVIGNIAQESDFNPTAVNPKSGAFGLFQHLGPRRDALFDFARQSGRNVGDARTQLDFAIHELNGPESAARDALMQADSPGSAALAFSRGFERAGKNERADNRRISRAEAWLNHMMEKRGMPIMNALAKPAYAAERPEGDAGEGLQPVTALPEGFELVDESPTPAHSLPDGFELVDEAPAPQPEPSKEPIAGFIPNTPEAQTAIRSTVKGLAAPAELLIDAANAIPNLAARGVNAVRPGTVEYLPMGKEYVDAALRGIGVEPEAQSTLERATTAALGAMTGAGAGKMMEGATALPELARQYGAWSGAIPAQQAASAAGSSVAGDIAHESGAGPGAELVARVVGGMAPSAGYGVARAVGKGAASVVTPTGRAKSILDESVRNKFSLPPEDLKDLEAAGIITEAGIKLPERVNLEPPDTGLRGIHWTTAMLNPGNGAILALEKAARTRDRGDKGMFFDSNLHNQILASSALRDAAWSQAKINAETEALNARTTPMREVALMFADQHPDAPNAFTSGLQSLVDRIKTEPGSRVDETGPLSLAAMAERYMNPRNRTKAEVVDDAAEAVPVRMAPSRDVDVQKDDVVTAIRKLGGLSRDEWGDMDITKAFKPHPQHGPVFAANGNPRARGMDDMTSRLIELGYLPHDARPVDLEDLLTDISTGVADPSRLWSNAKAGYDNLLRGERSEADQVAAATRELVDEIRKDRDLRTQQAERRAEKKAPKTLPARAADVERLRRNLGDMLKAPPSMDANSATNKVKNNRRLTTEMRHVIQDGLDEASGGRYSEYLQAHRAGMEPITEGSTLKALLERFDKTNPLPGTDLPSLSPYAFRRGVDDLTYENLGKSGHADKLTPAGRKLVADIAHMLNSTERAMTGARATLGSNTAADSVLLLKQGLSMVPGGEKARAVLSLLDSLGMSSGTRRLDYALAHPKEFQKLLDAYHAGKAEPGLAEILKRSGTRLPLTINVESNQ